MKPPTPSTVLAVDDEPKALLLLRNLIEPEGHRILLASSGAQALELAAREQPDVVLLDVMMPEMDGFEVCRRLRADPLLAELPIIMLTALDDRASRLRGLEMGADDFVSKPFDSVELRTRVRTITRLNRFRRLYEHRARFEAAITHSSDGMVLVEADGTIIHRNQAFCHLLDPAAPVQDNLSAYLPAGLVGEMAPAGASAREITLNFMHPAVQMVELTHCRVPWEGRDITLYTLRNITERKTLENQLLRSQRIELLGQLAGSTAHDMNNILGAIYASVELIEMKNGGDLPLHLGQIMTVAQRGAGMMRQLLLFASGQDGTLEPANPAGVAAEVAGMVKETFGRTYPVDFHIPDDLPCILIDPNQIHQIVMNLCVNARDAMPDGGRLSIAVSRRSVDGSVATVMGDKPTPGDYVAISVRDQGTGIPPEILPRLFDPFFTTKPKGKGTGLGLATVIRLVQRHKGFITLETEVGKGTCFNCHFPVDSGLAG